MPKLVPPWWLLPSFILTGQLLLSFTGFSLWAQQVKQEFMLTGMFYMAMLGPVAMGWVYVLIRRLNANVGATQENPPRG